jgi:segregation and condensation protein B
MNAWGPARSALHLSGRNDSLSARSDLENAAGWRWNRRARRESAELVRRSGAQRNPKMARLEAALFVAEGALSAKRLVQLATLADAREALQFIDQLNAGYDCGRSAFRIEKVAAGYQILTRPELAPWLDRVHQRQARLKLSAPLQETLTIIAYRQPCTRADVESVRGVQSAEIIKQLMEKNLVRVTGEDDSLGRPYLYGTTRLFLETFGLTTLDELPMSQKLRRRLEEEGGGEAAGESAETSSAA